MIAGPVALHLGDSKAILPTLPDFSVDSIVTDPPYELGFMGKKWDASGIAYDVALWSECLRIIKPGGHLLAFGGSRTYHRMASAIEDAGFEVRDQIMWLYGSGFPKSLDVSKAIDKAEDYKIQSAVRRAAVESVEAAGLKLPGNSRWDWTTGEHAPGNKWWAEFQAWMPGLTDEQRVRVEGEIVARVQKAAGWFTSRDIYNVHAPATEAAKQWDGWGTALKPAHEPIVVARKPLIGTVAANVLTHGTGALNIHGCRVSTDEVLQGSTVPNDIRGGAFASGHNPNPGETPGYHQNHLGRWPANVIHDGSDEVLAAFPVAPGQSGVVTGREPSSKTNNVYGQFDGRPATRPRGDSGSAARFFYCAKASRKDRGEGNTHPTVKPTELMRYLCRLVTPPGGTVLDPFMGSGSTGKAALREGFRFIGIEREPEYFEIAKARVSPGHEQPDMIIPISKTKPEKEAEPDLLSFTAA